MWLWHREVQRRIFTCKVIRYFEKYTKKMVIKDVSGMAVSTSKKNSQVRAKSGYLTGVFGCLGALRGALGAMDG